MSAIVSPSGWLRLVHGPSLVAGPDLLGLDEAGALGPLARLSSWKQWTIAPKLPNARKGTRTLPAPAALAVVVDTSLSMDFSDPAGLRYSETYHMIGHIARDPDARVDDTCAVVAFAGSATSLGPLPLRQARARRQLKSFLQRLPAIEPGTRLEPAIEAAANALDRSPSGSHRVLILVTDGEVFLGPEEVADVIRGLGNVELHLVAADCDGTFSRNADAWAATELASFQAIRRPAPGQLAEALSTAVNHAFGR
jgi:von Willebrand factor type A domain